MNAPYGRGWLYAVAHRRRLPGPPTGVMARSCSVPKRTVSGTLETSSGRGRRRRAALGIRHSSRRPLSSVISSSRRRVAVEAESAGEQNPTRNA